jgi:hypothetical protein
MDLKITLEVLGVIGGTATILALFLGPMFYLGSKIDAIRSDMAFLRKEMYDENKDFHGRLCNIEEKRIKIIEK